MRLAEARPVARRFAVERVAGVRVPALSADCLAALYAEPDLAGALFRLLALRGEAYHVLGLASPALAHGIDKWLADPAGDHRRCIASALAYVARCAMRCTPLAACATVSLAHFDEFDGAPSGLRLGGPIRTRTRLDADWLYRVALSYESGPEALAKLMVRASGNAFTVGDRLEVLDAARAELRASDDGSAVASAPTSLNFTPAVRFTLERAQEPVLGETLAQDLALEAGASREDALGLIAVLVELGALISELRTPFVVDQGRSLAASVGRVDEAAGERLEQLSQGLRRADAGPLDRLAERLAELTAVADGFAKTRQFYQIDATRTVEGTLGAGFGGQIEAAFHALSRVVAPNLQARCLAELFARKHNEGREVPLLRLLETRRSFDFETEIAKLRDRPLPKGYYEELLALTSGALASGERSVHLDELIRCFGAERPEFELAPSYEIIVHPLRSGDALVPGVWNGFHEGSGRSLSRFGDMLGDEVQELLRRGAPDGEGRISAEFSLLPRVRRSANVVTRTSPFPYELADGVWPAKDHAHTLTLDDIVVGVHASRIYLRSQRLGMLVGVRQSHLARQTANSRIAAFLSLVAQSDFPYVGFSWGAALARLPFKPRAVLADAVIAPAAWMVPLEVGRAFGAAAGMAWRARWGVPRWVYLTQFDNRILLDLTHELCIAQIVSFAGRASAAGQPVELHEALPSLSDASVGGPHGKHVAELAVSLRGETQAGRSLPTVHRSAATAQRRPPGSEWVYARCYLPLDRAGYFLERKVAGLLAQLAGSFEDFHFVRYLDPDPHLRLRFRCASPVRAMPLLQRFAEQAASWVDDGALERFELGTYDREIERYGGVPAIGFAERVFSADSALLLSVLPQIRVAAQPFAAMVRDVALTMLQLGRSWSETVAWSKDALGRRPHLDATAWAAIKAVRTGLCERDARYDALGASVRVYLEHVSPAEQPRVKAVLLHMHCNRLGASAAEEARLGHCAAAAIESEHLRRSAAERAAVPA